jgi:hypothetical protein
MLFVSDVTFVLQYPKLRTDGGVIWFAGQFSHNFSRSCAAKSVQNVYDLPLSTA